jgi:hypothetical protein
MNEMENHVAIGALFESVRLDRQLDHNAQSHMEECEFCRERVNWMQTASKMAAQETYDPPEGILTQVLRLGRNRSLLKPLLNLIVASVTFDSFFALAPAGIRRTEDFSRQLTYEAGNIQVTVALKKTEKTVILTGQVIGNDHTPVTDSTSRADVVVDGEHLASTELSSWGEFIFPELPIADCDLQICLADRVLRLPKIPLMDLSRA